MKFTCAFLIIVFVFSSSSVIFGQSNETTISGNVRGDDQRVVPATWIAQVEVNLTIDGVKTLYNDDQTNPTNYQVRAPRGARVVVSFSAPKYYEENLELDIGNIVRIKKDITLDRIPESSFRKNPSERKKGIQRIIGFAEKSGLYDLAIYNLKRIKVFGENDADIDADISKAIEDLEDHMKAKNIEVTSSRKDAWQMFENIIKINEGMALPASVTISSGKVMEMLGDNSSGAGIRGEIVNALPKISFNVPQKEAALKFLREQTEDTTSPLFAGSLSTLAKIGTDADKLKIVNDIKSTDSDRAIASITVATENDLKNTRDALGSVANNESRPVSTRQVAIQGLGVLASRNDEASIKILTGIINSSSLRMQAIEALQNRFKFAEPTMQAAAVQVH